MKLILRKVSNFKFYVSGVCGSSACSGYFRVEKKKNLWYTERRQKKARGESNMGKHYRQIIVDLAVDDNTPDKEIEDIRRKTEDYVKSIVDGEKIYCVTVIER